MKRLALIPVGLLTLVAVALAATKADIVVMTQNQYLGADLTAITAAETPESFNAAVLQALASVAANDFPSRVEALAAPIARNLPHLVGLQEVVDIGCIEAAPGACALFGPVFNDHLAMTLDALEAMGADYYAAATVVNLQIPFDGFPFPGLPVFLGPVGGPHAFITVTDRDVILAAAGVPTVPVPFPCLDGKFSGDGCNYREVAVADTVAGPLARERGFVGVDASVNGSAYRFVNTHLEVRNLLGNPLAPLVQAAQATQLLGTLAAFPIEPQRRLLVVGDINSSPLDAAFTIPGLGTFHPPYLQLADGVDLVGSPLPAAFHDVWELRPGRLEGFTCCQAPNLSNQRSDNTERVDVIFSRAAPGRVKASALDEQYRRGGLWPSDHYSVVAEITY